MRGATARTPTGFRRLRWALPIVAVALLSFGANARAATVTVGSPLTQAFAPTEIHGVGTVANATLPEPAHVTSPISRSSAGGCSTPQAARSSCAC
jgi:hypothetical protein